MVSDWTIVADALPNPLQGGHLKDHRQGNYSTDVCFEVGQE